MRRPDALIGLDDALIEPTDVPADGLLILTQGISEPRVPAIIEVAGRDLLCCWRRSTPNDRLMCALDDIHASGFPTVCIAGLDPDAAVRVVAKARKAGIWVVLDPAIQHVGRVIGVEIVDAAPRRNSPTE